MSAIESAFRALPHASLDDRIALLQMLVERWYGPIEPHDACSVEALGGLALPRALRWWMTTVGKKKIFVQNHLRGAPSDVRADCTLVFLTENQGCFELASPLGAEDPRVRWREPGPRPNHPWGTGSRRTSSKRWRLT